MYATVTAAARTFCGQRGAAAWIALLVGARYVLRIHSRRLVLFFAAGAATPVSAKAAEALTAPARKLRRVRRASRMEAPPVFAALRSGGASAAEYRARGGPCQGRLARVTASCWAARVRARGTRSGWPVARCRPT